MDWRTTVALLAQCDVGLGPNQSGSTFEILNSFLVNQPSPFHGCLEQITGSTLLTISPNRLLPCSTSLCFKVCIAPMVSPSHLPFDQLAHSYSIHTAATDRLQTSNCDRSTHTLCLPLPDQSAAASLSQVCKKWNLDKSLLWGSLHGFVPVTPEAEAPRCAKAASRCFSLRCDRHKVLTWEWMGASCYLRLGAALKRPV
ncbi:unnamed protein product [Pleuronectes platessa]|uniref:Uncharacterized protein n=1 Tax=Pleuronectes platessa TaxID=8262 RepID=A0A9N7V1I9_PLEPL|nr:unnamed protein product [Pleuronectes platessa]